VRAGLPDWISQPLRLAVNAAKRGTGRPWERQFLGFRIPLEGKIETAPQSVERFKTKVREWWRRGQSRTRAELRDAWRAYVRGGWADYGLAEDRRNRFGLEGWIRRHMRACFWQRWANGRGRRRKLRRLGLSGRWLKVAHRSKGAWRSAASPSLQTALRNAVLRRDALWMPSDLAAAMESAAVFNRRRRATRTSGGVGGCRGAIPDTRPDRGDWQCAARALPPPAFDHTAEPGRRQIPLGSAISFWLAGGAE
jgi:hypothetical protein